MEVFTIYALKLAKGKWYVGRTKNFPRRHKDHVEGRGSEWTKFFKPLKVDMEIKGDGFDEDKWTKIYMSRYGIDNVRGGVYCQMNLTPAQIAFLKKEIEGALNLCYKCKQAGHLARYCPVNKRVAAPKNEGMCIMM